MPVVCDMQVIRGNSPRNIGDNSIIWESEFSTGGRHSGGHAILMFMVQGLNRTTSDVTVRINDKNVGVIENYRGAKANHWFAQVLNIGPGILVNGNNELRIEAVSWPGGQGNDLFDDFQLKDVVCFFQQRA